MSKIHDYNLDLEELQRLFDNDSMWELDQRSEPPEWVCEHEWVETVLITSKVYDCKICGAKKG